MTDNLSLEEQILVALRRITRAIDVQSRTLLHDHGLTAAQLATLQMIARLEPITAGAVARGVLLGQPTITGILNRLEKRGLIRRVRGDLDRRRVNVSLTDEGRRVLTDAPPLLQDQFRQTLVKLRQWEQTQILATLQRIADMMDVGAVQTLPAARGNLGDVSAAVIRTETEEAIPEFNSSRENQEKHEA